MYFLEPNFMSRKFSKDFGSYCSLNRMLHNGIFETFTLGVNIKSLNIKLNKSLYNKILGGIVL